MDQTAEARRLFLDALALQEKGELERAASLYQEALALAPERPSVMNNLATVFIGLERFAEARVLCERLLERDPADEVVLLNLGSCQIKLGSAAEALNSFEKALRLKPGYAEAHYNRGNALLELKRLEEALVSYDHALAIRPDHAEALYNRGNALLGLGRLEEAIASYDRALAIKPDHADALNNSAIALLTLNRREEVIETYKRLLRAAPDYPYMRGYLLNAQLHCCEWAEYDESVAQITGEIRAGKRADTPFHFVAISESAADQLQCSWICAADEYPAASQSIWRGERYSHDRIRVAYLSADFHNHAAAYLIAGLLEAHDKARFEITAVSLGPDRDDEMRARLKAAVDRFIDAGNKSDREAAALLRELEIDIAVDLQGYTRGCRPGIFSHRGAPVQVNYLGYPGTMGADYIDYIIGDRHVIPREHHPYYTEKVVYLPDSYQVNDSKRKIAERTPTRAGLGLPEKGFVFCCFNNNYKITPRVFGLWMRLLGKVEGSVLWLLEDNEAAARNLRREAGRRGVAPERLIFAQRVKLEEYLARYRQADLFLDTLPYNAHTIASDALWAGLPVLTCLGSTFAGSVAASLLSAVGLQELITTTQDDYEKLALKLAADGRLLAGIRARLAQNRLTHPLFDTDRFRRHIEAAYVTMWERAQRGEPPVSFAVPAIS